MINNLNNPIYIKLYLYQLLLRIVFCSNYDKLIKDKFLKHVYCWLCIFINYLLTIFLLGVFQVVGVVIMKMTVAIDLMK